MAVDKVDAVSSWTTPTCVREVQGFAGIAKPMTDLTRKDKDFTWGTEEEAAF